MNDLSGRRMAPPSRFLFPCVLMALFLAMMAGTFGLQEQASAHAELIRADPPADGLVITPPKQLHLFYTEEVERTSPAPSLRLLDENGTEFPVTLEPVPAGGDAHELVIDVPEDLANGTWTLAWSVTSATDGHTLSGTYAFRIGGGLPPGIATVEGEQPKPWAVATRWLTFIGASFAAAGFLFGLVFLRNADDTLRWRRRRGWLILGGSVLALVATLAEPLLQTIFASKDADLSLGNAISGLPDDWWYRPFSLIPLLMLTLVVVFPLRGRISLPIAIIGGLLGLVSLLGLSFTSHASGRQSWRWLAVLSDTLHQWSTALWVGGLACLVLWWTQRPSPKPGEPAVPFPLARFSSIALVLFVVAAITGVANAGLVFPMKDYTDLPLGLGDRRLPAIAELWNSDYGVVLLIKSLVLILPFALAAYHHRKIASAARTGIALAGNILTKTFRLEAILVLAVVLGGSIMALSAPPTISENALKSVTLASFAIPKEGDPTEIVHITVNPARQGNNTFDIRLTDLMGNIPQSTNPARIVLDFTSLNHGTHHGGVGANPVDIARSTYSAEGLDLSIDGWWEIDALVQRDGEQNSTAVFYMLLPDPNVHGFGAPPAPATDPAAETLFNQGIQSLTSLKSVRRDEHIGSGSDALVSASYTWVTGGGDIPPMFEARTIYSASFVPLPDGTPPRAPNLNSLHSVTIGDQSWQVTADGQYLEQSRIRYQPPAEWASTYTGAQEFQMGTTQTIDGELCQIITFHTPNSPGQSEAWFSWWIGVDTGYVRQTSMVANQHYMVWHNYDFDADIVLTGPPVPIGPATPVASPSASPEVATPAP